MSRRANTGTPVVPHDVRGSTAHRLRRCRKSAAIAVVTRRAAAGMAAVVRMALADIAPVVSLYVNHHNVAARRAYARVGFEQSALFTTIMF